GRMRGTERRLKAGFARQLAKKLRYIGDVVPHLRQKGAALAAVLEDQTVHTWADLCDCVGFGRERKRLGTRQQRHFHQRGGELGLYERLEAWIQERGCPGVA